MRARSEGGSEVSESSRIAAESVTTDPTQPLEADKSLGQLVGQLTHDLSDLFSTQLELAKVEIKEEVGRAGRSAGMLGGAAVAGYLALVLLAFAAAWGLSEVVPEGVAFLIVGLVFAVVAAVLFVMGRNRLQQVHPVPEQSVEELKEDVRWVRQQKS